MKDDHPNQVSNGAQWKEQKGEERARSLLVGVYALSSESDVCQENIEELARLADTYGIDVAHQMAVHLRKVDAGTYLGSGKVEEIAELVKAQKIDVVIFDDEIHPAQQRNLEKVFACGVIDRTELILEVFAQRAHTKEAHLQIELAQVRYQYPRLKRLWTHLSRQRMSGGAHVKGEGEKQIEIDRRLLQKRMRQLERQIKEVAAIRETQRHARLRSKVPTFAIVGYTNAGKSTLLNSLTDADVLSEDKLFATLDTTTRKFMLPNNQEILLIDTVGFIRKIPHTLVAAFRSTLEEAIYTDVLLHLVDISHPAAERHTEETFEVLKELGAENYPMIMVLNKLDACDEPARIRRLQMHYPNTVIISAVDHTGFEELAEKMMVELSNLRTKIQLRIPQSKYGLVSELMENGNVIDTSYEGDDVLLTVEVPKTMMHKVEPFMDKTDAKRDPA